MSIAIILVEPQMGENIGAAARSMKNFALCDFRIVNPRDGWPNQKAINMSVGAVDLINNAHIFNSIDEAIADLNYVYATTAINARDMNKAYVLSRDLPDDIKNKGKVGILFGRENCGLNNQEIAHANKILTIDTDLNFSSLNIAHAVAVIAYQLFQAQDKNSQGQNLVDLKVDNKQLVDKSEFQHFYNHLFDELSARNFFKTSDKKTQMTQKIKNIFTRIENISHTELQTLRGIVKTLSEKEREK